MQIVGKSAARFEVLSPALASEFPELWYQIAEPAHFWMRWRLAAFLRQMEDLGVDPGSPLEGLDIGCGHGVVQSQLGAATAWKIDGCDLNRDALERNEAVGGRLMLYDIHQRLRELGGRYDFVVLFDVIEHVRESREFLEAARFHLKPGGFCFVNVPASTALFSSYDRAAGHLRRYSRRSLREELESAGFRILDVRYWGLSLLPLAAGRKLVGRFQSDPARIIRTGFAPPNRFAAAAAVALMRLETTLLSRPFAGTSALAAAVNPG